MDLIVWNPLHDLSRHSFITFTLHHPLFYVLHFGVPCDGCFEEQNRIDLILGEIWVFALGGFTREIDLSRPGSTE